MINTNVFDYIGVLGRAADASWLRDELINNNIANVSTPGYKRQDTNFEDEFKRALSRQNFEPMDTKVRRLATDLASVSVKAYTDGRNVSYRVDGNNVDIDTENVMLAKNQIKYQGLTQAIAQEFSNLSTVMK